MHRFNPPRPMLRPLLYLALTTLSACSTSEQQSPVKPLPAETNLLLITLDTTRADRIGSYGHVNARTPHLDSLAANGLRFDRAYAHVPLTLPTHASLLTGTLPPEHGIHDNGRRALSQELTTLAEIFQERGYRTGAFVSAIALDASFGLDRGFDVYDDQLLPEGDSKERLIQRSGNLTTRIALDWLGQGSGPFFAWVHYYDPHAPYSPPAEFAGMNAYDGEIAFMDGEIGRLLGWLSARDLTEKTLVVAIADHGESLLEKGEHTHAALIYDGTQRIPFLMSMPGVLPAGQTIDAVVGQSDLFPTLMELYNWAVPDQVSGRSLAPAIFGAQLDPQPVWLESEYAALNFGWSSLQGIVQGPWKYVKAPVPELYHLIDDPGEERNLATSESKSLQHMQASLAELQSSMGSYLAVTADIGDSLAQDLSNLGYAQGSQATDGQVQSKAVNPIEHIETLELYHLAIGYSNQGLFDRMIPPLKKVQQAFPNAAGFRTQLGDAYRRVGRLAEARVQLEAAVQLDPTYDPAHFYLGELAAIEGHGQQAIAAYRRTLELRPDYEPAQERLAGQLAGLGKNEEALALFTNLANKKNAPPRYWSAMADLYHRLDRQVPRLSALERAVEAAPGELGAINQLAWALATSTAEQVRNGARANELSSRCVEFSGGTHPQPFVTLAAAQAELGLFDQSSATLERAIGLAQDSFPEEYLAELRRYLETVKARTPLRDSP